MDCSNIPNLVVVQAAVGEKAEKLQLYSDSADSKWASLYKRNDSFTRGFEFQTFTVPVITIDELMEEQGLDHVDFMKMDIEGHELFALRGASVALRARRSRPYRSSLVQGR
jgi:FkbM family methyltransferase